jgi:hypothetical protein
MQVIVEGKLAREYPKTYVGHGIREQASEFSQVVRSGELESSIMSQLESLAIMQVMDEIREMIDLKYPFEAN